MGLIGGCCKLTGVLITLLALFIGFLTTEHADPIFKFADAYDGSRGTFFKGMFPRLHKHTPWKFTHEDLSKLDLTGQTVLVTGANTGLGYWTAHHIAGTGAHVVLACRSLPKCNKAVKAIKDAFGAKQKVSVEAMELDLGSFASIRAFAKKFNDKFEMLDSLVLNAGIMVPPFALTVDGLESQIGVNHFGHFLLTDLLMAKVLKAAKAHGVATIVPVTSAAHYDSYPEGIRPTIADMNDESTYDRAKAYGQSKLANVLFAQELAERYKSQNVLVNSVHPGGVDTELGRHIYDAVGPYLGYENVKKFMDATVNQISWKPKDASLTQIFCAVSPKLKEGKITGKYYHPIARETVPDPHAKNKDLQKKLWKLSQEYIKSH